MESQITKKIESFKNFLPHLLTISNYWVYKGSMIRGKKNIDIFDPKNFFPSFHSIIFW